MNNCIALVATIVSFACVQPVSASRMKTIFVFGDSLSDGFQLERSQAYPALLVEKLRRAALEFEVVNSSVSGDRTAGGLRRLPNHLKERIDIFILELGINDAFWGVPVSEIEDNLQKIIDTVKERNAGVRIIIVGMQLPDSSTDDYVGAFGKMYVDLATRNRASLVPYLLAGVGGNPALNFPDRIHPNAAGHKILAENVWKILEPVAREVSGKTNNVGVASEPAH
jgi:acyl-CoA thioesterase I